MKIKRAMSLASFSLCMVGTVIQLSGCASVPKPAEADGSSRVPANDAGRVQALQQRVSADRQLLNENNLLRAQVDVLQTKLNEMTAIVREALMLPPAPRPQPAPVPVPAPPVASPQSMGLTTLLSVWPRTSIFSAPRTLVRNACATCSLGSNSVRAKGWKTRITTPDELAA